MVAEMFWYCPLSGEETSCLNDSNKAPHSIWGLHPPKLTRQTFPRLRLLRSRKHQRTVVIHVQERLQ